MLDKILTQSNVETMRKLSERLSEEPNLRASLVREPEAVLRDFGIDMDKKVRLGERERVLIELFSDPRVATLYQAGKVDELREYIVARHQELTGFSIAETAGWAVADFDVAIVAEAVAVAVVAVAAVAIGAIDPMERLRMMEAERGILTARVEALDARVRMLESLEKRFSDLENRIG